MKLCEMVEMRRIELLTPCLQGRCSPSWATPPRPDASLKHHLVGLSGLEPPTSRLSGVRSNRLSYRPMLEGFFYGFLSLSHFFSLNILLWMFNHFWLYIQKQIALNSWSTIRTIQRPSLWSSLNFLLRKEVIQPHLPIRLPCYDFTPIINPTFDCCLPKVSSQASGVIDSHGVTGGVYKARERIHRDILIRDY